MYLRIRYDLEEDGLNLLKSLNSRNIAERNEVQHEWRDWEKRGDGDIAAFLVAYQQARGISLEEALERAKESWRPIDEEFFSRADRLFQIKFPKDQTTLFVSTNPICTYDPMRLVAFVYYATQRPRMNVMHELFHLYTYAAFRPELEALDRDARSRIVESLTVLLNTAFNDLAPGEVDKGYADHRELRDATQAAWQAHADLHVVMRNLLSLVRPHAAEADREARSSV